MLNLSCWTIWTIFCGVDDLLVYIVDVVHVIFRHIEHFHSVEQLNTWPQSWLRQPLRDMAL